MNRIEVIVTGPTGSGKSIILAAIAQALKKLEVNFLSPDLELERALNNPDQQCAWEMDMVRSSYVVLKEVNQSRGGC